MTESRHYTFGDTDLAAERLVLLARAFEPSTRGWLAELDLPRGARVLDLGCGPGATSALLAQACAPSALYGIDQSERLLERARAADVPHARFVQHDLTTGPLPVPRADVLYCRFLLTHLAEPARVLQLWADAALPDGGLLLEEVAALESEHPAFVRYYALVEQLQAHYGQITYIGGQLEALASGTRWMIERARVQPVELPAATMARLHALNIRTWGQDEYTRSAFDPRELPALGAELQGIARGAAAPPVICRMAQVALRPAPSAAGSSASLDAELRIEPASAEHARALLALQRSAFALEAEREDNWSIAPLVQTEAELRDELLRGPALIASRGDLVVGSVRARIDGSTAHVARLMVRQELQGRGIGQALMAALHARCSAARRFELFTGAGSLRAQRFYEQLGYVRTGTGRECNGVEVVYMAKTAVPARRSCP